MTPSGGPSFTATHGVIDRIHGDTSDLGPFTQPAFTAGFAQIKILMGHITQLADGGHHLVAFENTTESLAGNDQVCHYGATDRHFVQELSR